MRPIHFYLFSLVFSFLVIGCSGNDDVDPNKPEPDKEWDKTRTVTINFISNLTENNPYSSSNYNSVGLAIEGNDSHLIILDKANVSYGTLMVNPGANIAVVADRVPAFVPISTTETEYRGSFVLCKEPIQEMELAVVADDCRMMPGIIALKQGLTVRTALLSFDSQNQIEASSILFKSAHTSSTLITGSIKRSHIPALKSVLSTTFPDGSFALEIADNTHKDSEYAIYVFGSMKWKFQNFTEELLHGTIKSFFLQIEFL